MSIVQSIEETGPCTRELIIQIPADDVDAEMNRVVGELRRQVNLPGFRKGKTPASVVKSRFRSDIHQEIIERLVPRYWQEAQSENELDALIPPRVEDVEIHDGQPMTFKAIVEVRPRIDLHESREFELPDEEVLVGEAEVDEVIERVQDDLATYETVDRAAAQGDRVQLEIRETPAEDGSDDESDWQEVAIEVGDQQVWEELSLAVTGLEAGAKGDFTHQDPPPPVPEGQPPQPAPAPRHFQFVVREVSEKQLAEADDELAKKVSDFDTLDELRGDIEKRIFEDKKQRRRQEREGRLVEQLVERNPLEPPEGVVAREIQSMLRDYAERLAQGGVDLEQAGIDWQAISKEMEPRAKQRVHAQLVLDAVAEADEIEVPDGQVSNLVSQLAQAQGRSLGQMQDELRRNGGLVALRNDLRRQRTVRHLLGETLDDPQEHAHVHGEHCDHDHDHAHDHQDHDHQGEDSDSEE